jgi:hypothetical protein
MEAGNVRKGPGLSIFLVGVVLLLEQLSLSRILSATVGYHAAFGVIALVMLGLAASGSVVFLHRQRTPPLGVEHASTALIIGGIISCVGMLGFSWIGLLASDSQKLIYVIAAAALFFGPFFLCGYALSHVFAEFPKDVGRLYWLDLTGAATGCAIAIPLMNVFSSPQLVVLCGLLSCVAGVAMTRPLRKEHMLAASAVAVFFAANAMQPGMTKLRFAKGMLQDEVLWEEWNHVSRVNVLKHAPGIDDAVAELAKLDPKTPEGLELMNRWGASWGLSPKFDGFIPQIRYLQIDSGAGTPILEHGPQDLDKLDLLEWDVTSAAHHLRRGRIKNAFVVGGGGGRDILTALYFGAENVEVAELNPGVVNAVQVGLADFSGSPYSAPKVQTHIGEARAHLANADQKFDIIQLSMIDTFAASAAGSLVFSENVLYTVEAFQLYYDSLTPDGLLTVSRFYDRENFGEVARTALVATTALASRVDKPLEHFVILYSPAPYGAFLATCIVNRAPFTKAEMDHLAALSEERGFSMLYPKHPTLSSPLDFDVESFALGIEKPETDFANLTPPTDDNPFFFNVAKPFWSWVVAYREDNWVLGNLSTLILVLLIGIIAVLQRIMVFGPLRKAGKLDPELWKDASRPFMYFGGIGVGFMCVELALLQRYAVFLGHPAYGLSVVLFTLLLMGGLGSWLSARLIGQGSVRGVLAAVVVGILLTAFLVPLGLETLKHSEHTLRIIVAVLMIAPLGVLMGMAFPFGVRELERNGHNELIPWAWAVNGVSGVFATAFGMLTAMTFGYTVLLVVGACAYVVTIIAARPASAEA